MASHNLGEAGAEEGKPVLMQWRWYDGKPTLPLWIALAMLLIVPQENRKWQAWLILVGPLLAVCLRLIIPSETADTDVMVQLIITFAIAWAAVWLLAPYLSKGNRLRTFASALAVMFAVGIIAYVAYFGFWCDSDSLVPGLIFWATGSVFLLLALTLSGACCGSRFHPGLMVIWLAVWLPLLTTIGMVVMIMSVTVILGGLTDIATLFDVVPMLALGALMVSGVLYAVNLPVLVLAGTRECYRERMRAMVYRDPLPRETPTETLLADDHPVEV